MPLTDIGSQKTPARPVEITFAAETGLPSDNEEVLLIGHAASGATGTYQVIQIENSGDLKAASGECATKFGAGSELTLMVLAAIRANQGSGTVPALKTVPLASTDTDFGPADAALTAAGRVKAEFLVSCYDGLNQTLTGKLRDTALAMSGPQRPSNNQYGTVGVVFNRNAGSISSLFKYDTQYLLGVYLKDSGSPAYSVAEMAAAAAAKIASLSSPYNPLDSVTITGVAAPASMADWPTVGAGLESEAVLNQGWTPLFVKPNGEVAFVRTVTMRLSPDGSGTPIVTAYYDVQDFMVLYFFRKTISSRFNQPDFRQRKASDETAKEILAESIRLATLFEDQGMFQAVKKLAPQFAVERNVSDRHRFDVFIPVNVVPGLHVIASNIQAGTQFDVVTV